MTGNYIHPYKPPAAPSISNTGVLIDPTWDDLRSALQEVQKGCKLNRIPERRLKLLYEQAQEEDFFSAYIMTADEAPAGYGFDYHSTQAAACRLYDVTGFIVKRETTRPGNYVEYPIYPLNPKDDGFNYLDWLNCVARIFWTRLTDEEIDFLQMAPILQKMKKDFQDELAAQNPDKKWYEAQLEKLNRRPLAPDQWARRHQKEDERIKEQQRLRDLQRQQRRQREMEHNARQEQERQKNETNRLKVISIMVKGHQPRFVSFWQDSYESIIAALKAEGKVAISWKEFQKRWPSLATTYGRHIIPLINNGMIALPGLADVESVPMFTLSMGLWTGAQRLFARSPQLVFKINSERLYTQFANENIETRMAVNEALLNIYSGHPIDEWNVGWLRVHVDGPNKLVFIDEVQSDAIEALIKSYNPDKALRKILTRRTTRPSWKDRPMYLPSERRGYPPNQKEPDIKLVDKLEARRVERMLAPWNLHGFASVKQWAHAVGYRAGIHGRESAQKKPGMSPSERKWNMYYAPIIKQFKLTAESVPGYPAPIMVEKK